MNILALIKAALEDNSGGTSSMRVMCGAIVFAVLAVWIVACVQFGGIVELGEQQFNLLLLALGAKTAQRVFEKPETPPTPPPAS